MEHAEANGIDARSGWMVKGLALVEDGQGSQVGGGLGRASCGVTDGLRPPRMVNGPHSLSTRF